jgi:hypothetical protein
MSNDENMTNFDARRADSSIYVGFRTNITSIVTPTDESVGWTIFFRPAGL